MNQTTTPQGKTGKGYLYPNKKANDRQPDFRGKATINGEEFSLSAWKKTDAEGIEFLSVAISDPTAFQNKNQSGNNSQESKLKSSSPPSSSAPSDDFGDLFQNL